MPRVVLFLFVSAVIVGVAWLVASIPGHVTASIGAFSADTSTPFAILVLAAFIVLILMLLRLLGGILHLPSAGAGWRRHRRFALGQKAITRVLVALAAGEQGTARKESRRARRLLGDSPQTLLLVAEASRLSGREDEAEEAFRALTKQRDARFLGLRGLLRQAVDRRDWSEALVISKQAEATHPGAAWLRQQRAELALQTENWAEALELVGSDPRRPVYYIAAADAEPDTARALGFAKQAWKQDPTFPPAALAYAARLRATGREKRAKLCVFEAWKRAPHPDLAAFTLSTEANKLERMQIAKRLVATNPTHLESRFLIANVALEAGLSGEARNQIAAAQQEGANQRRWCLLLAEVEELERGETEEGRVAQRDALHRAATADPDPHWQCTQCNTLHTAWHPKCVSCGNVGTILWLDSMRPSGVPMLAT